VRKQRKLSQEALAERAGSSSKFVSQIERGQANPSLGYLHRLSEALGLELWDLLRFDERSPSGPTSRAAYRLAVRERLTAYVLEQPAPQIERALRILEAALGDLPKVR
jgi:transcriptional regulator with XRE-family HTH domain